MPRARFLSLMTLLLGIFAVTAFAQDDEEKIKQKRLKQRDDAIAKIKELGGSFALDEEAKEKNKPLLKVNLAGTAAKNADLEVLKPIGSLEELRLGGTRITNSGLAHIKGLINLKTLDLRGCGINNDATQHLKGLVQLQLLSLEDTEIDDAGLDNLKNLKLLSTLNLKKSRITDRGVAKVKKMLPECNVVR
jgi:hypothetical protein